MVRHGDIVEQYKRVGEFTSMGFTTFAEWSARLGHSNQAQGIRQSANESCERSLALHSHRENILSRNNHRNDSLVAAVSDPVLAAIVAADDELISAGWIPVFVEQPIFCTDHKLAGTPDAVFFKPATAIDGPSLLITDLKYNKGFNPMQVNRNPSERFAHIFGQSDLQDTYFHKCGMQLNAYL